MSLEGLCMSSKVSIETRSKIIEAALRIIAQEGFQSVTTRKIAAQADVNIALLHYHFGSKENIINEALSKLTGEYVELFEHLKAGELKPKERLKVFFFGYSEVTLRYPDIIKNFVANSIYSYPTQSNYIGFIQKQGLDLLKATVKEMNVPDDDTQIVLKLVQILSGIAFPVLLGAALETISGINFEDQEVRYQYIGLLIDALFPVKG